MEPLELNAKFYSNWHLIDPSVRGVVYLEDKSDEFFWNSLLQNCRPGYYKFMGHSKEDTAIKGGCEECLKYRLYFNEYFFTCIDSDMRYILQESGIDARHYIFQTYCYSWENHLCEMNSLQKRFELACPDLAMTFDFRVFLSQLSRLVYTPLLGLINSSKSGIRFYTIADFRRCIPNQCKRRDLDNNGEGLIKIISERLHNAFFIRGITKEDLTIENNICRELGINEDNAYLHIRGHNVYDLILYIGWLLCKPCRISFEQSVMNGIPDSDYWEMMYIETDLKSF